MSKPLFVRGDFRLHSGIESNWKIDCDALTQEDWETIALLMVTALPIKPFNEVVGVPRGGQLLAEALEPYRSGQGPLLIVDDVLTTGESMEAVRETFLGYKSQGAVVFARGRCPSWVHPLFVLNAREIV